MNWKPEAIERLRRYDYIRASVENIPNEIRRLELEAKKIVASRTDKAPVINSVDNYDEELLNNIICRQELQCALECARIWITTTDRAMGALPLEEQQILQRMYVSQERGAVGKLCEALNVEQSTVYRKRDQALLHFTVALYGSAETQFGKRKE